MTKPIDLTSTGYIAVPGGHIWYEIVGAAQRKIPLLVLQGGPGMPHGYMQPFGESERLRPNRSAARD